MTDIQQAVGKMARLPTPGKSGNPPADYVQAPSTLNRTTSRPLRSTLKTQRAPGPALSSSSPPSSAFLTTKRDKRHIKHSHLLSKVKKSFLSSSEAQRNKRRRQKKQLVANLGALADALPEDDENDRAVGTSTNRGIALREQSDVNTNLITRRSMKSRPGAMKRRENIDKGERERFAKNLAQMNGKTAERVGEGDKKKLEGSQQTHGRWAALRGFIAQTMERRPEMMDLDK